MNYTYEYPMQSVTVDMVAFAIQNGKPRELLIERLEDPFKGFIALPGGHIDSNEPLLDCGVREFREETCVLTDKTWCSQVGAFGDPNRDPRGHYITVAYTCILPFSDFLGARPRSDAKRIIINSRPISTLNWAFDHQEITSQAMKVLGDQSRVSAISFLKNNKHALEKEFTARHMREFIEIFREETLDPGNFSKSVNHWVSTGIIQKVGTSKIGYKGALYSFI